MNAQTTAQTVSALLNDNGIVWETADGRSLDDLCEEFGGVQYVNDGEYDGVEYRWEFDDNSAICYSDGGWDIEGSEPFLMSGLE